MNIAVSSPAIVTLPCGCFFRGREFFIDPTCEEHQDESDIDDDPEQSEYTFDQLDDRAKEKARDWFREDYPDNDWWDSVYDDADTIAEMLGITIDTKPVKLMNGKTRHDPAIYFSGFWSQGDGACFEGSWAPTSDPLASLSKLMEHAPKDERLHDIAFGLAHLSERCNQLIPDASVTVKQSGHYSHSGCTTFEIDLPDPEGFNYENELQLMVWNALVEKHGLTYEDAEIEIKGLLRGFMDWIYRQLEEEHEYLTSDEHVDEMITGNDYRFDEDGNRL